MPHTPGKLHLFSSNFHTTIEILNEQSVLMASVPLPEMIGPDDPSPQRDPRAVAIAKRLVAAWNALDGISTEDIEAGCVQLSALEQLLELRKSNADLLAAAKTVLYDLEARIDEASEAGEPVPVYEGIAALHTAIGNAIAAEGQQP